MSVFPITFSIPKEKIINHYPENKTKILSSLIPGKMETYIYQKENDYYQEYQSSFFAMTFKKGGWDCMRHYEIIANGAIPFFPNIEQCPPRTMVAFPKHLVLQGNQLYDKFKNASVDDPELKESTKALSLEFLNYTRENLTCEKVAQYILDVTQHTEVKNILFLSGSTNPDYLRCLTLIGFKKIFGTQCHDFPKIDHIYKNFENDMSNFHGRGFTLSKIIEPDLYNSSIENDQIEEMIQQKAFDLIIYGSYHRGMPFWKLVCQMYDPKDVVLLCGEDLHPCNHKIFTTHGYNVFVREQ